MENGSSNEQRSKRGRIGARARDAFFERTLGLILLLLASPVAWSVDTPATMLITGTVEGKGGVVATIGDRLLVVNRDHGGLEATGKVLSRQGLFSIQINKTSAFNGTKLTLQFEKDGSRYDLLEGEEPADFAFRGGLIPTRVSATLSVGRRIGDAIGDPGSPTSPNGGSDGSTDDGRDATDNGGGSNQSDSQGGRFDLNNDGAIDQLDIDVVKGVVAGKLTNTRADVNGDQLVNTRDIIAVIKAVNRVERARRKSSAKAAVRRGR